MRVPDEKGRMSGELSLLAAGATEVAKVDDCVSNYERRQASALMRW